MERLILVTMYMAITSSVGELKLGQFDEAHEKEREQFVTRWLTDLGW